MNLECASMVIKGKRLAFKIRSAIEFKFRTVGLYRIAVNFRLFNLHLELVRRPNLFLAEVTAISQWAKESGELPQSQPPFV